MLVLQAIGSGAGQVLEPARAVAERNGADCGAKRSCWRSGAELMVERSGAAGGAERSCWQSGAELLAERSGAAGGAERSCRRSGTERGVWVADVSWEGCGD